MASKLNCRGRGREIPRPRPGDVARCSQCGLVTAVPAPAGQTANGPAPAAADGFHLTQPAAAAARQSAVEVRHPGSTEQSYAGFAPIRNLVLAGKLARTDEARVVTLDRSGQKRGKWQALEKISARDFGLETLYRPLWAHAKRGLLVGWFAGLVLKIIDTGVLHLRVGNLGQSIFWLLFAGALVVVGLARTRWAWTVATVIGVASTVTGRGGFWIGVAMAGVVAFLLAAPLGMAVGTVVGLARRNRLPRAGDATPEGSRVLVLGLILPLVAAGIIIPLYFFWFSPLILAQLGGN